MLLSLHTKVLSREESYMLLCLELNYKTSVKGWKGFTKKGSFLSNSENPDSLANVWICLRFVCKFIFEASQNTN